jgi:hypothetical protein
MSKPISRIPAATVAVASAAVAAVSSGPAGALERTRAKLASTEADIANLWTDRDAALRDFEGVEEVEQLDEKIARKNHGARILKDKIPVLEAAVRDQARREAERLKAEALEAFERRLSIRAASAALVEKALNDLATGLTAYDEACARTFAEWPHGLFPALRSLAAASQNHLISRIAGALGMPMAAAQVRLSELAERLGPIEQSEIHDAAELVELVRTAPLPEIRSEAA